MPENDPQAPNITSTPPPKRKKGRRRLIAISGLLAALLILGGIANGPGARWLVHHTVTSQLNKFGLKGDLHVKGRASSGFTLEDGSFVGEDTGAEVHFDSLRIGYKFSEFLDGTVRDLHGTNLQVVLDATQDDPTAKTDEGTTLPNFEAIAKKLRSLRDVAKPPEIEFTNVSLRLLKPQGKSLSLGLDHITHTAGSDSYHIRGLSSNAMGEHGQPKQDIKLRWSQDELVMNAIEILPDLYLGASRLSYPKGSPLELTTRLDTQSSRLDVHAGSAGTVAVELTGQGIDLQPLLGRLLPGIRADGRLTRFRLHGDHLLGPVQKWTLDGGFAMENGEWNGRLVGDLEASAKLDERIALTIRKSNGLAVTVQTRNPLRQEGQTDDKPWWKGAAGTVSLETPSLHQTLRTLFVLLGQPTPGIESVPDGRTTVDAEFLTEGPLQIHIPNAAWSLGNPTFKGRPLPDFNGTATLTGTTASATLLLADPAEDQQLELNGHYDIKARHYSGELTADLAQTSWIEPFLPNGKNAWAPDGPLHLKWKGSGSLNEAKHRGELQVHTLNARRAGQPLHAEFSADYQWPDRVNLPSLLLRSGNLRLGGGLKWADERLHIQSLRLEDADGPLASVNGSLPLAADHRSVNAILAHPGTVDLRITTDGLDLRRLRAFAPIPMDINGVIATDLRLGGTFPSPTITGSLRAKSIQLASPQALPLLTADLDLSTKNRQLEVSGMVSDASSQLLELHGNLPLNSDAWVDGGATIRTLPIELSGKVHQLELSRLQVMWPPLAKAEGTINGTLRVSGTPQEPQFNGEAVATVQRLPLGASPHRDVRNASIRLQFDGRRITIQPSSALIAGGRMELSGGVDLTETEPQLDLRLNADHALLWRDDKVILRSNGDLRLTGPWKSARLTGSLALVECLYYKDIEIIPLHVPTDSIPKLRLPHYDANRGGRTFRLPDPFADWSLDIRLRTQDPILIRGNVATGSITGDARIQGTMANPRPTGKFVIERATAELPFSTLNVKNGILRLRPDAPLNPDIDIRGSSSVNSQRITINLYGSLNDPKYHLASGSGLPENEILSLLATGSTSADLEDPGLARSKAFQLFIAQLRSRAERPGGNQLFRELLGALDTVELKVGENDPFSGRKFNSATLQLEDRWYLSAAVDGLGHTRGLIIFSMRFK